MDKIASLIEEHAALRSLAEEIERSLGKQAGVGRDDRTFGALPKFMTALQTFQGKLKAHEEREERIIGATLRGRTIGYEELEPVIQRAHASLEGTLGLLRALSAVCDGTHVHAVRTVAERLRAELEAHLKYEELVLFPLLRRHTTAVRGSSRQ